MSLRFMTRFTRKLILANLVFVLIYLAAVILAGYLTNSNRMLNINTFLFWLNAAAFDGSNYLHCFGG